MCLCNLHLLLILRVFSVHSFAMLTTVAYFCTFACFLYMYFATLTTLASLSCIYLSLMAVIHLQSLTFVMTLSRMCILPFDSCKWAL